MKSRWLYLILCFLAASPGVEGQGYTSPSGKLFIIGGGDRPPSLMKSLVATAGLQPGDYAVVLPMSSESPDTSFVYFKADLESVWPHSIVNFNFTPAKIHDKSWLDSLAHAKLVFITGGDQDRFMSAVLNTPVYNAIHDAFRNGATIAGTSAGAAAMSKYMITGNSLLDTAYRATFSRLRKDNLEIKEGLALLDKVIIDQHFIVRSRYNRLLSAIAKYPSFLCIGIDEETAIIVQGNRISVAGSGQVVVLQHPVDLKVTGKGLIKMKDIRFSVYTEGDVVEVRAGNRK
ncbi:MAG TPA: cyanophycinase [Chitinophagaceae bacterium]|nr:cyanophycinase [Chitinophagaceae bacterium]